MRHYFSQLSFVLTIVAGLSLVGIATAGPTVPHKESVDGRITAVRNPTPTMPVGRMDFAGGGVATHMGKYTEVGGHDFTADGNLRGTFTSTAADGSTISGVYVGTFRPLPGNKFRFDVTAEYQRGTGRLAGVTGKAAVVAVLDGATGLFHFDGLGTWTLP